MSFAERPRQMFNAPRRAASSRAIDEINSTAASLTTSLPAQSTLVVTPSNANASSSRRKKSRSPASKRNRTDSSTITTSSGKKRKSNPSLALSNAGSVVSSNEGVAERGRRTNFIAKPKAVTQSRHSVENAASNVLYTARTGSKKERSKSRDHSKEISRKHPLTESALPDRTATAPFWNRSQPESSEMAFAAEILKLKEELSAIRKQAHEQRKTINKQSKVIDELRQKLSAGDKIIKENESQILKFKSKTKKADEAISNIEASLSCQICMDVLMKPFALSPCGHVLCQGCLQEWFRKAPANEDDMYDDDDPDYLMYRIKSCPCCRTTVRDRPVPVFIVKAIAAAVAKAKATPPTPGSPQASSPPPVDGDPWEGLFPPAGEDGFGEDDDADGHDDEDDDDDDDEDEDEDDYHGWMTDEVFAYGSGSDDEPYEGEYVSPQWEPPTRAIDLDDEDLENLEDDDLNVLRRGATIEMLDTYQMTYTHSEGLIANVHYGVLGQHHIHLGWNIQLSADDDDGEEYVDYLFKDIVGRPERWDITEDENGSKVCRRLVTEDQVEEYDTTDSEAFYYEDVGF